MSKQYFPAYRPDIDGLRALAILSVVIFHAFPPLAPGGFVGVDVFFVISGYLITLILLGNIKDGRLSLVEFYVRRILRIFPAALLVLATCFVVGWFVLLPDELKLLGKHIAASASFVENLILWTEAGYFDVTSEHKPLMHFWSLAVEEQFYLLFPFLLWLAWRTSVRLLSLVGTLFLVSFCVNIVGVYYLDPTLAFFGPLSRFWELMTGALLAIFHTSRFTENSAYQTYGRHSSLISLGGLLLVAASVFAFDKGTTYPGESALLPVIGTAMMIVGNNGAWINRVLLANRLVVYVGKISYPLYLWHWPLLVFPLLVTGINPGLGERTLLMAISVVLASATYHLLEKPIRFSQTHRRIKVAVLLGLMLACGYIGYNAYKRNGLEFRIKALLARNHQFSFRDIPDSYAFQNNCIRRFPHFGGGCLLAQDSDPTVALLGDSHSLNLFFGVAELARGDNTVNVLNLRRDSSLFLMGVGTHGRASDHRNRKEMIETSSITSQAMDIIANSPSIHSVVLVLRGADYFDENRKTVRMPTRPDLTNNRSVWQAALKDTLEYLEALGKRVIVVIDWPELGFDPKRCLNPILASNADAESECALPRTEYDSRSLEFRQLASSVLTEYPRVKILDAPSLLCDKRSCYAKKDGEILYVDQGHLSLQGALQVGAPLVAIIRDIRQ